MSGGVVLTVKVGRSGTAGANVRYMTRERATEGKQERVWTHNIPEYAAHPDHAEQGISYKERTGDLREYARQLEEDEIEKPQRGSGEKRTHYRAIYSFDREVTDEKAREMVDEHLQENFPKARAIAAIHRDTDNAHVHVQIAARGTDDRKLHFNDHAHQRLDERWARIYGKEFGKEIEHEHAAKKEAWREWMRAARQAKLEGREIPPRPRRVAHERNQVAEKRKMHAKQYGLSHAKQTGTRDNERRAAHGERPSTTREQPAGAAARNTSRELAEGHGAIGSVSQPTATERAQQPDSKQQDRQQPGRVSRADRAASNRTQSNDRTSEDGDRRSVQTSASAPDDVRQKRADERRVYQQHSPGRHTDRPLEQVHRQVAGAAQNDHVESDGRDVREHDSSGAFDRVLSLMETVTDQTVNRGREQVAGINPSHDAGAGQADREQIKPARADYRREHSTGDERRADARAKSNNITNVATHANQPAQPQITDAAREEIEKRVNAGMWRGQYLIELVQIGLKERDTGQNAEAERKDLQLTMYQMREAEDRHVKTYGGQPRAVLTTEERDYLAQHQDAPAQGFTRELIKKELAQAFVIGEARAGERLEKEPERQHERTRERGFERSR
jgi:hypothetical protein